MSQISAEAKRKVVFKQKYENPEKLDKAVQVLTTIKAVLNVCDTGTVDIAYRVTISIQRLQWRTLARAVALSLTEPYSEL